ncbi:hypothetical protein ACROYT_G036723 [Oculina patagonica]
MVVFFNFIFFVFGCVLIGVGAWTLIEFGDYVTLSDSVPYATGPKVMIAAGVLVAIISFLGCCGAWKENRCMLVIFFICLLVILGLEIAAGALGYKNRSQLEDTLGKDVVRELEQHYGEDGSEGTTKGFDALQQKEKCCGWNNYKDWFGSQFGGQDNKVPDSCCKEEKEKCGEGASISTAKIYTEGCKDKLETLLKDKLYIVGAIGVTVVVIQILGMIFALVLICQIGKEGTFA